MNGCYYRLGHRLAEMIDTSLTDIPQLRWSEERSHSFDIAADGLLKCKQRLRFPVFDKFRYNMEVLDDSVSVRYIGRGYREAYCLANVERIAWDSNC